MPNILSEEDINSIINETQKKTTNNSELINCVIELLYSTGLINYLRNLKIIGIFTRLAKRDNKKKYLKLIPYAWKLIEDRIDNNVVFIDLKKKLKDNFPEKIRIKK